MIRLAIVEDATRTITNHMFSSNIEQGAFCLVREGRGHHGIRLLVTEVLLPPHDAWEYQGQDMLKPSARWISSAVSRAIASRSGLLFIHSHPDPSYPMGLSVVDKESFHSLAQTLAPMLDGPFGAVVVHPKGWTGVVWSNGGPCNIDQIVSIGRTVIFLNPIPKPQPSALDSRQQDALGHIHDRIRNLSVAIVGVGGLGSPTAEQLIRMGVAKLTLLDHDLLDTHSNVRRVFGATMKDFRENNPESKVAVVQRHLAQIGLGVQIHAVNGDVRRQNLFRYLLDADVVFNATDTHGSRAIINELASTFLLPVIDMGVRVGTKANGRLSGLVAEVRVLTPTTPCLWCRGTISADIIRVENLPVLERERLEHEGYVIQGIGDPVPSVVALTVVGSGLATSALLTLLSEEGDVCPSSYWVDSFMGDSCIQKLNKPKIDCRCQKQLGLGDSAVLPFL